MIQSQAQRQAFRCIGTNPSTTLWGVHGNGEARKTEDTAM